MAAPTSRLFEISDDYARAKAARDEQAKLMARIEAAHCATSRDAVLALLKEHEGKPGVERLIEAYRDAEKNAPQRETFG